MPRVTLAGREYAIDLLDAGTIRELQRRLTKEPKIPSTSLGRAMLRRNALAALFHAFPEMNRDRRYIKKFATFTELGALFTMIGDQYIEMAETWGES